MQAAQKAAAQQASTQKRKHEEEDESVESLQAESKRQKLQHEPGPKDRAPQKALSNTNSTPVVGNQDDIFRGRSPAERQAALSLIQFAESDATSRLSGGRVEQLLGTLMVSCSVVRVFSEDWLTSSLTLEITQAGAAERTSVPNLCNGATSTAKVDAANKGAHAANQVSTVEAPTPSGTSSHLTTRDELDEYLKLEATLKAKIAALRTVTVPNS